MILLQRQLKYGIQRSLRFIDFNSRNLNKTIIFLKCRNNEFFNIKEFSSSVKLNDDSLIKNKPKDNSSINEEENYFDDSDLIQVDKNPLSKDEKSLLLTQKNQSKLDSEPISEEEFNIMYSELFSKVSEDSSLKFKAKDDLKTIALEKLGLTRYDPFMSSVNNSKDDLNDDPLNNLMDHLSIVSKVYNVQNLSLSNFDHLINLYAVAGKAQWALTAIEKLESIGLNPSMYTYLNLMNCYATIGDLQNTVKTFKTLEKSNNPFDINPYIYLIKAYGKNGRIDDAFGVFEVVKAKKLDMRKGFIHVLINVCFENQEYQKAWEVFDYFRLNIDQPSQFLFNIMIKVCARQGRVEKAFNLFEEMKELGLAPDIYTYNGLISACSSRVDYFDQAMALYNTVKENGFEAIDLVYVPLLSNAKKSGKIDFARKLTAKIFEKDQHPQMIALSLTQLFFTYCTVFKNKKRAADHLIKVKNQKSKDLVISDIKSILHQPTPTSIKALISEAERLMSFFQSTFPDHAGLFPGLNYAFLSIHCHYFNFSRAIELYHEKFVEEKWSINKLEMYGILLPLCFKLDKQEEALDLMKKALEFIKPIQSRSTLSEYEKMEYMKNNSINTTILIDIYRTMINGLAKFDELDLAINLMEEMNRTAYIRSALRLGNFKTFYNQVHKLERPDLKIRMLELCPSSNNQSIERTKARLRRKWTPANTNGTPKKFDVSRAKRQAVKELYESEL